MTTSGTERSANLLRVLWDDNKAWVVPVLVACDVFMFGVWVGRVTGHA